MAAHYGAFSCLVLVIIFIGLYGIVITHFGKRAGCFAFSSVYECTISHSLFTLPLGMLYSVIVALPEYRLYFLFS